MRADDHSPAPILPRRLASACLVLALAAIQVGGCATVANGSDSWAVRPTTIAGRPRIQSLSDVNRGRPQRGGALVTSRIGERRRGAASVLLQADAATAALAGSAAAYAPELDAALRWLLQLSPAAPPEIRIVLTLIDGNWRTRMDRSHDASTTAIVDLVVPVDLQSANTRSSEAGRALGIALHETSHAVADPLLRSDRARDEYRATVVESCYLIDTLRVGDSLRFRVDDDDARNAHFAAAQSRKAARRVMSDLGKAAGKPALSWSDIAALRALRRFCATKL